MSKSSQRRGKRVPKNLITNPLSLMQPTPKAQVDKVIGRYLSAVEAMAKGHKPTENEWRDLSDCINTIETMAKFMGKLDPAEVMPTVMLATDAMIEAANRFKERGAMRLSGPGLEALRDLVDWYRQCCEGLTEREMAMAQAETQRRVNALLRKSEPDSQVVML